jgi:hypothetical protein
VILVGVAKFGGTARGAEIVKELYVGLVVLGPLLGGVIFVINRLDRTYWFTGTAIHTLVGVDVERTLAFIDAVHRAFFNARLVFDIHARLCDYIRHVLEHLSLSATTKGIAWSIIQQRQRSHVL